MHRSLRALATSAAAAALIVTSVLLAPRAERPEEATPPPWDEAAYASFAAHRVAPPRTTMTAEDPRPVDLAAIRAAIVRPARATERGRGATPSPAATTTGDALLASGMSLMSGMPTIPAGRATSESADRSASGAANYVHMLNGIDYFFSADGQGVGTLDATMSNVVSVGGAASAPPVGARMNSTGSVDERMDRAPRLGEATARSPIASPGSLPRKLTAPMLGDRAIGDVRFRDADGHERSLIPRAYRVQVAIDGPRARTTVEYVFENPHDRTLEGTFRYALPRGATPAAFGMFRGAPEVAALGPDARLLPGLDPADDAPFRLDPSVPDADPAANVVGDLAPGPAGAAPDWGGRQTARVVEQTRAREVYESVVRGNVDPAVLEFAGGNTFEARVFPIAPRALKRVYLVFDETLTLDGDELRYEHPLPTTDSVADLAARVTIGPGSGVLRAVTGAPRPAESAAAVPGDVTGDVGGPGGDPRTLDLRFEPGDHEVLEVRLAAADPRAQAIVEADPGGLGGAAFFARVVPDLPVRERRAPTDRALFVVDASLSADGPYHGLSADLLDAVLRGDPTIREYAVLLFDIRPRWLHAAAWRPNLPEARAATRAELDRVYLEGATSFASVLGELRDQSSWLREAGRAPTAFLISDGEITWGQDRVPELVRRFSAEPPLRWIAYELGTAAANRALFDALIGLADGRTVHVVAADQVDAAARAHRAAACSLRGARVVGARATDITVAGAPTLLFPGQELRVGGRIDRAVGAALEVDIEVDGWVETTRVPLPPPTSGLAGRAFAELHVDALLALDDERVHRMVVALSQRFSLANEAASLLVLDEDADWERFDLVEETLDLDDLAMRRAQEEDQRLDRVQALELDGAPPEARALVAALETLDVPASVAPPTLPLLDRPLAGGPTRLAAELAYRASRPGREADLDTFEGVAAARALAGDTLGALRAWSTLIETRPRDTEAARLVGYACLALGQPAPAAEVFERIRLLRPFEAQVWLEEALALEAAGRFGDAARRYEIAIGREFSRHRFQVQIVATRHYRRLLRAIAREVPDAPVDAIAARLATLAAGDASALPEAGSDLQLTLHWSSDAVDIDLWVNEPEGECCSYGQRSTAAGGRLLWDITDGYGPELYHRSIGRGTFEVCAHYFGNNSPRWSVPTGALLVVDRDAGRPGDLRSRTFQCFVLGTERALLSLRREEL